MVGRCISYWNSPFLGDMLVFWGVATFPKKPKVEKSAIQFQVKPEALGPRVSWDSWRGWGWRRGGAVFDLFIYLFGLEKRGVFRQKIQGPKWPDDQVVVDRVEFFCLQNLRGNDLKWSNVTSPWRILFEKSWNHQLEDIIWVWPPFQ